MGPRGFTGPRGKNGKQGQLKIIVGPNTYASCFQYKVTDFNVYSQDQIFEPGEVAVVEEIHIQKVGGMPGPGNLVRVFIR